MADVLRSRATLQVKRNVTRFHNKIPHTIHMLQKVFAV